MGGHTPGRGTPGRAPGTDTSSCAGSLWVTDADAGQWDRDLPTPRLRGGPCQEHPQTAGPPRAAARCRAGAAACHHQSAAQGSDAGEGGAQRRGAAGGRQTPERPSMPPPGPPRPSRPPRRSPRSVSCLRRARPRRWCWVCIHACAKCDGGLAPIGAGRGCRLALTPPTPPAFVADAGEDAGKPRRVQQSKNWTFPNAKACGTADPFLCPPMGLEGLHHPTLVRGGDREGAVGPPQGWNWHWQGVGGHSDTPHPPRCPSQAPVCSPAGHRGASPEAPPPLPPTLSASSSRTPSASDVGDEGSTEARSRDGGHGPPGLEHSESLSDSLYDSLSSCGSQG